MPQCYPKFQAFDKNGCLLIGGKLYTYQPGTSTPKPVYADRALKVPHKNPVILDSRGEELIYLKGLTDLILKDSNDVQIWGPITAGNE